MTRQEFLDEFFITADKVNSAAGIDLTPLEIQILATEAQEYLILNKYNSKTNILKEGFEQTDKRTFDLGELVMTNSFTPNAVSNLNFTNGRFFTMPNTLLVNPTDYSDVFWIPVYEEVVTDSTCPSEDIEVRRMSYQEYAVNKKNPFRRPSSNRVIRLKVDDRRVELLTDGSFNITNYKVRYIKKPTPIDLVNSLTTTVSQLPDYMHRELLYETVKFAFKDTDQFNKLQVENQTMINQ